LDAETFNPKPTATHPESKRMNEVKKNLLWAMIDAKIITSSC
jgi:hypothetical protein